MRARPPSTECAILPPRNGPEMPDPCKFKDADECMLDEILDMQRQLTESHQVLAGLVKRMWTKIESMDRKMNRVMKAVGASLSLAILLAGCPSTSLKTATVLEVESKHRVGPTVQRCGHAEELIPLVERAWPVVVDEMVKAGIVKDRAALEKVLRGTFWKSAVRVCLVEDPDSCSAMKPGCTNDPRCARRRGCASSMGRYVWVARWWPPLCRGDWPAEPNCVLPSAPMSSDYKSDLVAELANLAWQASGGKTNYHLEPKVLAAINAATGRMGW